MKETKLNKYGEKKCILPTCKELAGHDGYYCENHHTKYYLGKTDCPMKGRMSQCSDKAECIHQPIEELQPYAERSREDWIKWAESEIVEYQKFLNFLKKKI